MSLKKCLIIQLCLLVSFLTIAQQSEQTFRAAFYNVENLFDTIAHTLKDDKEFTPQSRSNWNTSRYFKKVNDLAKVLTDMGSPFLVGLCEVENGDVLTDLCQALKEGYYQYIHHHSPDNRGVDVALIYQPAYFRPISDRPIPVFIQIEQEIVGTRDILHVSGIFQPTGDTLDVFVNHWPSRRGGLQQSEHRRLAAADTLRAAIERIWKARPAAKIIITGDFNDDPNNISLAKTLQSAKHPYLKKRLQNVSLDSFNSGQGTYNYQGNWNMLDQFILSDCLIGQDSGLSFAGFHIFKADYLIFDHPRYGKMPNRTYGGPNYYGGTSDHFPVYIEFKMR